MSTLRLLFKHEAIALAPNALNSDSSAATVILKLVCQGLVRIDRHGRIAPDLALSWEVSPCRRLYRFQLDPAARFHSGRPCTAAVVRRLFLQLMDGRLDSVLASDYEGLEAITAVAEHVLEFRFAQPLEAFLPQLAWRTHIVDDTIEQPCGTGAFRLREWRRGSHVLLERHQDGRPAVGQGFDSVAIRYAPEIAMRIAAIEAGEADIVESVPASAAARLVAAGLLETMAAPSLVRVLLTFNCAVPPFDDPRVRQAIAHAVDRDALIRDVMGGQARGGDGLLPYDDPWAHPVEPIRFDPELARRLLHEAGHAGGLTIAVAHPTTAPLPAVEQRIARDLEAVGVRLRPVAYDDPPWWPYVYLEGPWQMAIQGTASRPHFDTLLRREFCSDGAFNAGRYASADIDRWARQARHGTDDGQRRALYGQIQQRIRADLPVVSLFASNVLVGWRPQVSGLYAHPHGFIDLTEVRLDPAQPADRRH